MIGATSHRCTSLAGVSVYVSSRLFIDEEYTNGTYPTPDCNFVLSVVRTFLSYQHNSRRRYCTAGADTKKKNSISTAPGVV
eukprot:scaffold7329_cov72-Skeletonema_dohrnii-CCMP3373.AAC.1